MSSLVRTRRLIMLAAAVAVFLSLVPGSAGVAEPAQNTLTDEERAAGFVLLFDGKSLDGWTTAGSMAAWAVEDGQIVIKPENKDGFWLRTTRQYRDYELKVDFMLTAKANSGVGLRCSSTGDPAFTGMEVQILDTVGEAPSVTGCGAVYDAIAPTAMCVKPPGEWNSYRIRLVGDTLDAWLNGVQIHNGQKLDDRGYVHKPEDVSPLKDRLTTGYIALQDHGDQVRFRNIKVHDPSADPDPGDYEAIFNNTDLTGWSAKGKAAWTVEDGTLVGRDGPGHLFTDRVLSDLEVRAQVRISANGNSGMYFRTVPRPEDPDGWPLGYEAQVDNHDPKNFTGCIYDRAWGAEQITRDEAWFDYRVRAVGNRVQTWINGRAMVDADLNLFQGGRIALQGHNPGSVVMYRDIQVRDLSAATRPPRHAGKVRLFYCTHSAGFKHDVLPETLQIMSDLGKKLDWLEVTVAEDIQELTADRLARTDAVMFYTTGALPMGEMRGRLMEWVINGGALVGVHSATDTFAEDRDYVRTIGGTFDGHPWNEEVTIVVADTKNPITRPLLPGAPEAGAVRMLSPKFTIADEIYQYKALADDRRVLMWLDKGTPKMEANREYPLAWTREPARGRVFYTALGHRPEVWRDERYIGHVLAGIRWAAGLEPANDPAAGPAGPETKK